MNHETSPRTPGASLRTVVPVLRVDDIDQARAFYVDRLHFSQLWEHRFEPGLPAYVRIQRGDVVLDLSEHTGDGSGGQVAWIAVDDVDALHRELSATDVSVPAVDAERPGGPTLDVFDPFGNELRFCQAAH